MNRLSRLIAVTVLALLPACSAVAQQSETAGLVLQPVDPGMSTGYLMHHRPFVLPDHLTPAFDFASVSTEPITNEVARSDLRHFLELRKLPADQIEAALARFDDPALAQIIPAPNLRAALLMLFSWDPYQATIEAILEGKNESGHPFETVDFRPLEFGAAVAPCKSPTPRGNHGFLSVTAIKTKRPSSSCRCSCMSRCMTGSTTPSKKKSSRACSTA